MNRPKVLFAAALPLLLISSQCSREPDLPDGVPAVAGDAESCLAKTPMPGDCQLSQENARAVENMKTAEPPGIKTQGGNITFHNDYLYGVDGLSVHTLFKFLLLNSPDPKQAQPDEWNDFWQHTHGQKHTLSVATRTNDRRCQLEVKAYPIDGEDEILVYYGALNVAISWQLVFSKYGWDMRITKTSKPHTTQAPNCVHATPPAANFYWHVQAKDNLRYVKRILFYSDAGDSFEYKTQTQATYLRRILISNANGPKHFIKLESGCSAFKLCVRSDACETVPLCALPDPPCACTNPSAKL